MKKQLQEFGQQSREFAQNIQKLLSAIFKSRAQLMTRIERLIQAFSLIAARIDKKTYRQL